MKIERIEKQILVNEGRTEASALEAVCRKYFSAKSWEMLKKDIEKYGRVGVAIFFIDSRKERLQWLSTR